MPYELSTDEANEIVALRIWDSATIDELCTARRKARELCFERGFGKLLVNLRDFRSEMVSPLGCFDFGESLANGALPREIRVAHALPENAAAYRDAQFTLTVAQNRGWLVRDFSTPEAALHWLISLDDERSSSRGGPSEPEAKAE